MMTDLLNSFAPNGQHAYIVYWAGVAAMIIGGIGTVVFGLKICLRVVAIRIVQFEVTRLHRLLVPSHFNDADFDTWLFNPNNLTKQIPIDAILRGRGAALFWFVEACTREQQMVELYEGLLRVIPINEPTKDNIPKSPPTGV